MGKDAPLFLSRGSIKELAITVSPSLWRSGCKLRISGLNIAFALCPGTVVPQGNAPDIAENSVRSEAERTGMEVPLLVLNTLSNLI